MLGTIGFALGPALKLSRGLMIGDLKENAAEDVVRRHWKFLPRNPLVVAQIAFSLALPDRSGALRARRAEGGDVESGLQTERSFLLEVDGSLAGHDQKHAQELYRKLQETAGRAAGGPARGV